MHVDVADAMARGGRAAGLGGHVRPQPADGGAVAGGAAARPGPSGRGAPVKKYVFCRRLQPDRCGCRGAGPCVGRAFAHLADAYGGGTGIDFAKEEQCIRDDVADEGFAEYKAALQRGVAAQLAEYGRRGDDIAIRLRAVAPYLAASSCARSLGLCELVWHGHLRLGALGAYWPVGGSEAAPARRAAATPTPRPPVAATAAAQAAAPGGAVPGACDAAAGEADVWAAIFGPASACEDGAPFDAVAQLGPSVATPGAGERPGSTGTPPAAGRGRAEGLATRAARSAAMGAAAGVETPERTNAEAQPGPSVAAPGAGDRAGPAGAPPVAGRGRAGGPMAWPRQRSRWRRRARRRRRRRHRRFCARQAHRRRMVASVRADVGRAPPARTPAPLQAPGGEAGRRLQAQPRAPGWRAWWRWGRQRRMRRRRARRRRSARSTGPPRRRVAAEVPAVGGWAPLAAGWPGAGLQGLTVAAPPSEAAAQPGNPVAAPRASERPGTSEWSECPLARGRGRTGGPLALGRSVRATGPSRRRAATETPVDGGWAPLAAGWPGGGLLSLAVATPPSAAAEQPGNPVAAPRASERPGTSVRTECPLARGRGRTGGPWRCG